MIEHAHMGSLCGGTSLDSVRVVFVGKGKPHLRYDEVAKLGEKCE